MRRYRTDEELEDYARRLRRATGFEFVARLNLSEFLSKAASIFPGLTIETVDRAILGSDYAYFDSTTRTNDSLYVVDTTNNDAAWFNLSPEVSVHIRDRWYTKAA